MVSFNNQIFLFTTLEKKLKEEQFHYNDFFAGDLFHWDSQNSQHIGTPMIQKMVQGSSEIYLFSRKLEKIGSKSQPFIYCGRLEYLEHDASTKNPVHIVFDNIDYQDSPNKQLAELYDWQPGHGKPETERQAATRSSKRVKAQQEQRPSGYDRTTSEDSRAIGGQGYEKNPAVRKAIENHAMGMAEKIYKENGYEVEDTSATSSFDLRCMKNGHEDILVEVKGTRGSASHVTLTANEVKVSQDANVRWDLFIVHSIIVTETENQILTDGGQINLHQDHVVKDADLTPTEFRYRVPDSLIVNSD